MVLVITRHDELPCLLVPVLTIAAVMDEKWKYPVNGLAYVGSRTYLYAQGLYR